MDKVRGEISEVVQLIQETAAMLKELREDMKRDRMEGAKRDAELATMFRELAGLVSDVADRVNGRR